MFRPVAIETFGPLNASALNFLSEVGRQLTSLSGDSRETSFLFQRLSMIIQRFNSALIDSFCFQTLANKTILKRCVAVKNKLNSTNPDL